MALNAKIKILDCTLRDGGFVNDWNFGRDNINSIYQRLNESGVDFIELGFLNSGRKFDQNYSIQPYAGYFSEIINTNNNKCMLLVMIMLDDFNIDDLEECKNTIFTGVRLVYKKTKIDKAYEYAKKITEKGYKLFLQPASLTDYSDEEAKNMLLKMITLNPFAVYMVDTYGLMHRKDLIRYYDIFNKYVPENILIGFHSHDNYRLAYSNTIEFIDMAKREVIADCTVCGMGKDSGNANTELVLQYLNRNYNENYNISQIIEIIDLNITDILKKFSWGYSLEGFVAAAKDCHPSYARYLIGKKTLSAQSIYKVLDSIPDGNKTNYNKEVIEDLYNKHQQIDICDEASYNILKEDLADNKILIIAPGQSIDKEQIKILKFIENKKPVVFGINNISEKFKADYVFISNAKRYNKMLYDISAYRRNGFKLITTSNITETNKKPWLVFNYVNLIFAQNNIQDNACLMLLKIFEKINVKKIYIAGFDGFIQDTKNYSDTYSALCSIENADEHNDNIKKQLKEFKKLKISFLTPTKYN